MCHNGLIGEKDIQFYDGPSTNIDPIARRFFWNIITNRIKIEKFSDIKPTHTMDEVN